MKFNHFALLVTNARSCKKEIQSMATVATIKLEQIWRDTMINVKINNV